MTGKIDVRVHEGVAEIIIDHVAHRNALTKQMCLDLSAAAHRLDADPAVSMVVLRGAGDNFSAGAAIGEVEAVLYDGAGDHTPGTDHLSAADAALRSIRVPLISAVRGICMGGAWQIAACADIVLCADDVSLAVTPAKLGIVYPRFGLERLVERAGRDRAKLILLTGDRIPPRTAERWGLVTEVVQAEHFDDRLGELISTLAARSRYSAVQHKKLIDEAAELMGGGAETALDAYERQWSESWGGVLTAGDLQEGRLAFREKRSPMFGWRAEVSVADLQNAS